MEKIIANYNRETSKAIQLTFDCGYNAYENVWLPKSQINFLDKDEQGNCVVEIPMWLIKKQTPTHIYSSISPALAIANFATKNNTDVHCNA